MSCGVACCCLFREQRLLLSAFFPADDYTIENTPFWLPQFHGFSWPRVLRRFVSLLADSFRSENDIIDII